MGLGPNGPGPQGPVGPMGPQGPMGPKGPWPMGHGPQGRWPHGPTLGSHGSPPLESHAPAHMPPPRIIKT